MQDEKLRRQIVVSAAKLIEQKKETNLHRAKLRAARQLIKGYVRKASMPSDAEIQAELNKQYYVEQTDVRYDNLRSQRISAWNYLRRLSRFDMFLSGSVIDGDVRRAETLIVTFPLGQQEEVSAALLQAQLQQLGEDASDLPDPDVSAELPMTVEIEFSEAPENEGVSFAGFREILLREYPDLRERLDEVIDANEPDRFAVYEMLLAPLEQVQQPRRSHPEGDALYHSLQVFELARNEYAEDEDFLLAALLHDVGKGIDPKDPNPATLYALAEHVSERTFWFIQNLEDAHRLLENSLGVRAKKRLNAHPDYDQLLDLARFDRDGRVPGGAAPTLQEAIEFVKELDFNCEDYDGYEN